MGPAVDTAGNIRIASANPRRIAVLQWGQRLIPLETSGESSAKSRLRRLQWGQRLIPLETLMLTNIDDMARHLLQWGQRLIPLETGAA